jgi:hypothetical protein
MNDLILWLLFVLTFGLGYYLGGKGKIIAEEIGEQIKDFTLEKPKPGVVNHLSEIELKEKHDPLKRGNKEAFDRFFRAFPPVK